jgi:hypothetical protein
MGERKAVPVRSRFRSDGTVNPRAAAPRDLQPYVGPSGARRPVGWGGNAWMSNNVSRLSIPGGAVERFPSQFQADPAGGPDRIRPDYVPPPRGTDVPTGNRDVGLRTGRGIPDSDGISSAARDVASKPDIYRESLEQAISRLPAADQESVRRQLLGPNYKPPTAGDIQRTFDAIHQGSGGMSDGAGQVWRKPSEAAPSKPQSQAPSPPSPARRSAVGDRLRAEGAAERRAGGFNTFAAVGAIGAGAIGALTLDPALAIAGFSIGARQWAKASDRLLEGRNKIARGAAMDRIVRGPRGGAPAQQPVDWSQGAAPGKSGSLNIDAAAFERANVAFSGMRAAQGQMQGLGAGGEGGNGWANGRGWANPAVQAAAQAARGASFDPDNMGQSKGSR